jgi:hypothetical protein
VLAERLEQLRVEHHRARLPALAAGDVEPAFDTSTVWW